MKDDNEIRMIAKIAKDNYALCSYRIKMDENGAQECHTDFNAKFDSLKPQKKKFLKSNHQFFQSVQSLACPTSPIWQSE